MNILAILACLSISSLSGASYICSETIIDGTKKAESDFLFLIDNSNSMQNKINGVVSGVKAFVKNLDAAALGTRYAVVTFGGYPILKLPFTTDANEFYKVMSAISADDGLGQEASLEAMRMALTNNGSDFKKACAAGVNCILNWRPTVIKTYVHITDEDSDLPCNPAYRMVGQTVAAAFCMSRIAPDEKCRNGYEPPYNGVLWDDGRYGGNLQYFRNESTFRLATPYEDEIVLTAAMLSANGVFLNSLVSFMSGAGPWFDLPVQSFNFDDGLYENWLYQSRISTEKDLKPDNMTAAIYQFGNPELAVQNANFSAFDAGKTALALRQAGLKASLQYKMLTSGDFMRVFDIDLFATADKSITNKIISAFYTQVIQTTKKIAEQCVWVPELPTTSSAMETATATPTVQDKVGNETRGEPTSYGLIGGIAGAAAVVALGVAIAFARRRGGRPIPLEFTSSTEMLAGKMANNPLFVSNLKSGENELYLGMAAITQVQDA